MSDTPGTEFCKVCGNRIIVMAFSKTGVCCELCRKVRDGEMTPEQAATEKQDAINRTVINQEARQRKTVEF